MKTLFLLKVLGILAAGGLIIGGGALALAPQWEAARLTPTLMPAATIPAAQNLQSATQPQANGSVNSQNPQPMNSGTNDTAIPNTQMNGSMTSGMNSQSPQMNGNRGNGMSGNQTGWDSQMEDDWNTNNGMNGQNPQMNNSMGNGMTSQNPQMNNGMGNGMSGQNPQMNNGMGNGMNGQGRWNSQMEGNWGMGNNMNNQGGWDSRMEESWNMGGSAALAVTNPAQAAQLIQTYLNNLNDPNLSAGEITPYGEDYYAHIYQQNNGQYLYSLMVDAYNGQVWPVVLNQ